MYGIVAQYECKQLTLQNTFLVVALHVLDNQVPTNNQVSLDIL